MELTYDNRYMLAGFDICGWFDSKEGLYYLGSDKDNPIDVVDKLPEEIKLVGIVFTLEDEKVYDTGFFNAFYV